MPVMPEYIDPATVLRRLPYQGLTAFWRTSHMQDLDGVDVAIYGVPFDAGTSNRPGARFGPRSIREQSCTLAHMINVGRTTMRSRTASA